MEEKAVGESAEEVKTENAEVKPNPMAALVTKLPKLKKKTMIVIALIAIIVGAASYVAYAKRGWFVAATVNGSSISRLAVIQDLEKQAGKSALDSLITKKLIMDELKKEGITVKPANVNEQVTKAEEQVSAQGGTLDEALAEQGMTRDDLREQIILSEGIKQVLAEKVAVSDEEVMQYLKDGKMLPAKGEVSDEMKSKVHEQLASQKFNTEAGKWVADLRATALITYYVSY